MEFYAIIFFIGLVFLTFGAFRLNRNNYLLSDGIRARGRVIEVVRESDSDNGHFYYPVYEFVSTKHGLITKKSDIGLSWNAYKVNQKINVLYLEDDPYTCAINNTFRLVVIPRLLIAIGITILTTGFLMIFDIISLEN